jgi:hypothetical protein
MGGEAFAVPPLEREAQRLTHAGAESQPVDQHVADFAPRGEVMHRPLVSTLLDHPDDLLALLRWTTGGRERHHVPHDFDRVRGIVHQRPGTDGDLVAEQGGHLMCVASAADVPQQCDPVDRFAQRLALTCLVAQPHREQARPQLRLERLAESVVLCQGQRGHELTEAKGGRQNGEISRCMDPQAGGTFAPRRDTDVAPGPLETFYS